ncbi:MAG: DNA polymerase III subunit delta [Chloroflexi bacterium]|nr:MAG: DNA polymerase III subunit delta [Chloroflexota bacterium]
MLHVILGEDEFRAAEALRALKQGIDSDGSLATNTTVLPARGLTPQTLLQHAAAMPFLSPSRLVIVEGLLTTLGARRGVVEAWQQLVDFTPTMPESNHLVLLEPPRKRDDRTRGAAGSPLLAALRVFPNVTVTELNELKTWTRGGPSEVVRWLQDRAIERGLSIEPRAIEALTDLVGSNLRTLASELDKLAMYAGARAITAEDVRTLTPQAREERIFDLVDAVVEGRAADALRLLRRMREDGSESASHLFSLIARQLRMMVRAAELIEAHAAPEMISSATGARGYPLEKLSRQARAAGRTASEASLRAVEHSDHSVKTGRLDDDLALELLVVRLADLAPRGARARR